MNHNCMQHNSVHDYLAAFDRILEEMIRKMTNAALNGSISHNFIVQMIPHHRAAIEMSQNILQYTSNSSLQQIASNIIVEQTKSIENMQLILDACSQLQNSQQDVCMYQRSMACIMQNMFARMRRARASIRVDCDFMWKMIPHHQGAVQMAATTLQYEICEGLTPILEAIITSQKQGIAQMQSLLQCLGC